MHKNWSHYRDQSTLIVNAACRTVLAASESGDRVLMHHVNFDADTPPAVRMRLEYETAQLAMLSIERMTVPLDFEFRSDSATIVCPFIEGPTLAEKIRTTGLTLNETLSITEDLLESLAVLHSKGIVRRCIRPEEIHLQESQGRLRAFIGGYGPLLIMQGMLSADAALEIATYSSPEALGALEEDVRASSDLYSAGIVLFECLSGRTPFTATTSGDTVFHHMTSPVPDLAVLSSRIPHAVNDIVLRLLQKHPRDRYQSAAGVLFDLRQVKTTLSTEFPQRLVLGTMDRRETLIEPAFVGRSADMAMLQSELDSIREGGSRTVLVTGVSGLGKSRLLLEISRTAVARGFRILRANGQNQIGLAPLASLRGTLSQCLEIIRQDEALRTRLAAELSDLGRELQTITPEIVAELNLQIPPERTDELSDRRISVALATFLGALGTADRPLLLLMDDMQWADDLTLTMLECWHLTNPRQTMLIVGTRPHDATSERLRDTLFCSARVALELLNRAHHDQLLNSMAGGLPPQILDTVWEMSAGNPFVASAVLRGLVEAEILAPSNTGWKVDDGQLRNLQLCGEAAEVLKQRLFRLPAESQQLLAVGAVLGKEFAIEMAAELAEIPGERVLALLTEPRRNYLVWERSSGSVCVFMHDQIRDAILKTLSANRTADIHRRAAVYLSQYAPHRIFDIALHHDASGRTDLAKDFAIEAAEQARISHALESAEQQYRIALRSCFALFEQPDFRVLYGLGDVLMLSGRYQEAEPFFAKAIQCADSSATRAQVTLKLGELAFKEDKKDRAIELWESALITLGGKLPSTWRLPYSTVREVAVQAFHSLLPKFFLAKFKAEPSADDRLIWRLHSRLAYAYWFVRSKLEVLHSHLRGMNLAERYKPTAELAQAYSEHAPAMSLIPLSQRGIAYGRRSLQIRTEQNDIWGQGQSLHCLAIALYSAAQFEECVEVGRRSVRILERAGDFWEKHIAQYQVAASLYRLGRFTEAVQLSREAYNSGLAVGDYQVCGNIIEVWARASNGDIPPAVLQIELDRPRADVQGQAHVLLAKGICLISEGRFEEASEIFDQGILAAKGAGISNTYTSPLYAWKATALRSYLEGNSPLTRRPRRWIIREHRRAAFRAVLIALRFRNELPHALREYAWAHVFRNRNRVAVLLLKNSVRIARRQRAEYEVIQSELLLEKIRVELGCHRAESSLEHAERRHAAFRSEQLPQRMLSSVSLVDRFDSLLESGRQIAVANDPATIAATAVDAARRLLRSIHCEVVRLDDHGQPVTNSESIKSTVLTAIKSLDAVTANSGMEFRSLLVCPIVVRSRVTSCLVVGNSEVRDLFGANELRIARYITAIAGAALENADGFQSLQELNANLENIVEERTAVVEARSAELLETADSLRKTQTQLAAARDAAEQASRAKSNFLAHMSHEIRTPIGAVLGFTELLLNGDTPLQPEQTSHLNRVLSNGNHLHRLLNDLLDLSKIEAGQLTIESIRCDPYALLSDVLSSLQSRAVDKNLKLSLRVPNRIPETILTDPTRLRQILTNLIGNAIKFTETGSVDLIIDTVLTTGQLRIQIVDTGPGIPPSAMKDVFEPFKQADVTVARRFGGTGLGLPISRQLAQALGGGIELVSELGFGSTFTVTIATGLLNEIRMLNAAEAESSLTTPISAGQPMANLKGCRILIADDVEANRELFALVLRRANAECYLAADGQEAVNLIQRGNFDLVLMDMQMPVMNGYTAARALRSAGITLPIVAITANGMEEDQDKCRQAGCSGYLTKPISMATLLRSVSEQLGRPFDQIVSPGKSATSSAAPVFQAAAPTYTAPGSKASSRPELELPADPVFREFALRFLSKVELALPEIQSTIAASDWTRLSQIGHWIKGTGGTVGLINYTNMGIAIQDFARDKDPVGARLVAAELASITRALRCECNTEVLSGKQFGTTLQNLQMT